MMVIKFPIRIIILISVLFLLLSDPVFAEKNRSDWINYSQACRLFLDQGSQQKIISLCKRILKKTEDPVLFGRVSFLLAECYVRHQKTKDAHQIFKNIYKSKLEIPLTMIEEAKLREGQLFLNENRVNQAVALFTSVASLTAVTSLTAVAENDSGSFFQQEARFALAWHGANQGRWQTCDSLLNSLIAANPLCENDQRMKILGARRAITLGDPETAIDLLKNNQSSAGLKYLARAYELTGKQIMAVSIYKKIHDSFPNSSVAEDALFQAVQVYMRAGDWLAAQSELTRLMSYFPLSKYTTIGHFQLGWIYLNLDEMDKALAEFRSDSATGYSNYFKYMEAECLWKIGRFIPEKLQESIQLFNNIVSLDPDSPIAPLAKVKVAMVEIDNGDTSNAIISLRQFLSLYPKNEMVPVVNFLIAINQDKHKSKKYFDNIIQSNIESNILDAAYFALQYQDYCSSNYQKVITWHTIMYKEDSTTISNYWQRANHLLLAESAYFLKHYELAQREYDLAASGKTDDLAEKAALGKAWASFEAGNLETAAAMFRKLKQQLTGVNQINALYGYATALFRQGKYEEALQEYPVDIEAPDNPESVSFITKSLYRSAECYYRLQYYAQAIESWEKLTKNSPGSELAADATFQIGETYFRANYFSEADSVFQYVVNNYPECSFVVKSALRLAQSAYNGGDYELAVIRYRSFLENYPDLSESKDALAGIQLSYYQLGQSETATEILHKVIEQSSNDDLSADARYRIAENYLQEKKYREATESFKEIFTLYPNSSYAVDAQFALAKAFLAQENYNDANRELLRFIQYFPESSQQAEAFYLLGVGYLKSESYLSAIDYFNKTASLYPKSDFCASSYKNAAWCFDRLNEKKKALEYFDLYLTTFPFAEDRQNIILQKGRLFSDLNQTGDAIIIFKDLQKNQDKNIAVEASYRLGVIYVAQNEVQNALSCFKFAIGNGIKENYYRLSAMAQLAAIYENSGQHEKAISTYELLANSTKEEQWVVAAMERINALSPKY